MIVASHITKRFGKLMALNNVSFNASLGSCVGLIGPNGSGKSTLFKSILGFVLPDSGSIQFNGTYIGSDFHYREQLGYMPQISRYPDNMTIGQVFDMIKGIRQGNYSLDEELIDTYQLKKLFKKRMHTLSGGTRQKVGACIAFLFSPKILILDEPTAGLDPISSEIIKQKIIKEVANNKLIIISSHILSEMDNMISDLIYMQEGSVYFQKSLLNIQNETGEEKLSKSISIIMKSQQHD